MTTYADLPIELATKIVNALADADTHNPADFNWKKHLSALRLVSRGLNVLATPELFCTLNLEFRDLETSKQTQAEVLRCTEVITVLATGRYVGGSTNFTTSVFNHTKELVFTTEILFRSRSSIDPTCGDVARKVVYQHLANAVAALTNLETASCYFMCPFHSDAVARFMNALGTLPAFHHLQLDAGVDLTKSPTVFLALSDLQTLNIELWQRIQDCRGLASKIASLIMRSPNLQDLLFRVYPIFKSKRPGLEFGAIFPSLDSPGPLPLKKLDLEHVKITPGDIQASIRHFNRLERLSIMHNPLAEVEVLSYGNIWSTLHRNHIYLRALATDAIGHSGFAEYLTSYTGLRELVVKSRYLPTSDGAELVRDVIVHHHKTLEILHLGSLISCPSSPPISAKSKVEALQVGIAKCENLRELAVYYNLFPEDIADYNWNPLKNWLETAIHLKKLSCVTLRFNLSAVYWISSVDRVEGFASEVISQFGKEHKVDFKIIHTME